MITLLGRAYDRLARRVGQATAGSIILAVGAVVWFFIAWGTGRCVVRRGTRPMGDRRRVQMTDLLMSPFVALQVAVHGLRDREDGQTKTEYAIVLGGLALAIIIALFFLRNTLRCGPSDAAYSVSNAPNP
jgi:hypothetical protein